MLKRGPIEARYEASPNRVAGELDLLATYQRGLCDREALLEIPRRTRAIGAVFRLRWLNACESPCLYRP